MNKRYIDFVPAKRKTAPRAGSGSVAVPNGSYGGKVAETGSSEPRRQVAPVSAPKRPDFGMKTTGPALKMATSPKITRNETAGFVTEADSGIRVEEMFAERPRPAGVSTGRVEPKYGVIEDYHPKFVQTEVAKRPLGAKAEEKGSTGAVARAKKTAMRAAGGAKAATKPAAMRPVKAKFVNTNKIEKRPLSQGGATPKPPVVAPKETPKKKPEVIIAKPAKDSKAGMIVAIILTIILGAAAGTVAFLLLPK
ncbi:MAG: hypothetical protein Q4B87_00765 [Candidatus Saccharibacteria bacterium]|nr:hypothetical protein [Candidatus Saccharibacteria bacterium]